MNTISLLLWKLDLCFLHLLLNPDLPVVSNILSTIIIWFYLGFTYFLLKCLTLRKNKFPSTRNQKLRAEWQNIALEQSFKFGFKILIGKTRSLFSIMIGSELSNPKIFLSRYLSLSHTCLWPLPGIGRNRLHISSHNGHPHWIPPSRTEVHKLWSPGQILPATCFCK